MRRALLIRYWIDFHALPTPHWANLGCGVTAFSEDDALMLIAGIIEENGVVVRSIRPNVDVRELDAGHVQPNLSDVSIRGVWFPLGHALLSPRCP